MSRLKSYLIRIPIISVLVEIVMCSTETWHAPDPPMPLREWTHPLETSAGKKIAGGTEQ